MEDQVGGLYLMCWMEAGTAGHCWGDSESIFILLEYLIEPSCIVVR